MSEAELQEIKREKEILMDNLGIRPCNPYRRTLSAKVFISLDRHEIDESSPEDLKFLIIDRILHSLKPND